MSNEIDYIIMMLEQDEPDIDDIDMGSEVPPEARGVPLAVYEALRRYVDQRTPTGGFLRAVLSNDLFLAHVKADATNARVIGAIVRFIYNSLPGACWGSEEKVQAWLRGG